MYRALRAREREEVRVESLQVARVLAQQPHELGVPQQLLEDAAARRRLDEDGGGEPQHGPPAVLNLDHLRANSHKQRTQRSPHLDGKSEAAPEQEQGGLEGGSVPWRSRA